MPKESVIDAGMDFERRMILSMIQVGALGVAGALLAIQFKNGEAEYGIYISIALSILIFFVILSPLKIIITAIQTISNYIRMDSAYIETLLKMLGITYIAEFSSNRCKDAGYQTIAGQIEMFGKLLILALGTPILLTLLDTIKGFLS